MKKTLFGFLLGLMPVFGFSQGSVFSDYINYGHFLFRQPSARAEAMGRGFVAIDNDLSSYYFNPAGLSTLKGINFSSNYAEVPDYPGHFKQKFFSIGMPIKDLGVFALSFIQSGFTDKIEVTTMAQPDGTGELILNQDYQFVLTYAKSFFKGVHFGLNVNYFESHLFKNKASTIYFDLGVMYHKSLLINNFISDKLIFGLSLSNVLNSTYTFNNINPAPNNPIGSNDRIPNFLEIYPSSIPQALRIGSSYSFEVKNTSSKKSDTYFAFLVSTEYHKMLNSDYYSSYHVGTEITFMGLFDIRTGYFSVINPVRDGFTYGFGLNLALDRWSDIPLLIEIDFCNSPEPNSYFGNPQINSLQTRLVWLF